MANGWLDPNKYEHIVNTAATGPGTMYEGYSWKWVNHSTEGPAGSIAGTISLFQSQPASCPHFMIDPMGTQRRVQFIPWTWSAAALRGGANGWQTNRGRAVQVEICGYARDSGAWPDDALWIIADTIADVIKDGCPINPNSVPDDSVLRGTLATMQAPQRMGWDQWRLFDGVTAHVRVPNNDHWDCGAINSLRVRDLLLEILGGGARVIAPGTVTPLPDAPSDGGYGFLRFGMTGGQVTLLQQLLAGLGYLVGALDGIFGDMTEAAVRAFQTDQQITVDGVVGPETQARLSAAVPRPDGKPPLPEPADPSAGFPVWPGRFLVLTDPLMSGDDVRVWQQRMAERGWRLEADGFYGVKSFGVAKTFQDQKGLKVDGIVGPQSWDAAWTTPVT